MTSILTVIHEPTSRDVYDDSGMWIDIDTAGYIAGYVKPNYPVPTTVITNNWANWFAGAEYWND